MFDMLILCQRHGLLTQWNLPNNPAETASPFLVVISGQ